MKEFQQKLRRIYIENRRLTPKQIKEEMERVARLNSNMLTMEEGLKMYPPCGVDIERKEGHSYGLLCHDDTR